MVTIRYSGIALSKKELLILSRLVENSVEARLATPEFKLELSILLGSLRDSIRDIEETERRSQASGDRKAGT
jgi:hypothetical protein